MSVSFGRVSPLTSLSLLFLLCACAGTPAREGVTPTQAHMYAHFDRAGEVHDALVRGELDRAREGAAWIAAHGDGQGVPQGSQEMDTQMRRYAGQVEQAGDLRGAAEAAAQMGRTCGDCHRAHKVEPRFLVGSVPPPGGSAKAEMALHVWAAEHMWEGLVGPQDYAWTSGAKALKGGWLDPGTVVSAPADREKVRGMVQAVYEMGVRAEKVSEPQERARIYGEFLTTCIDCHRMTGALIR